MTSKSPSNETTSNHDPHTPFSSPKRKRESHESWGSPTRLRTTLPSRPSAGSVEDHETDPTSPRTKVSDQLHSMKLETEFSLPVLEFGKSTKTNHSPEPTLLSASNTSSFTNSNQANDLSDTRPPGSAQSMLGAISASDHSWSLSTTAEPPNYSEDIPQIVSPQPTSTLRPSHEKGTALPSFRPKGKCIGPSRIKSPPPTNISPANSDLVWTAAEITGYNPTDPADDGYGINGVGFRPTPAIAQARAQKRKQQVAEWKSREAKEARQRRLEKRNGLGRTLSGDLEGEQDSRKVRFVEG